MKETLQKGLTPDDMKRVLEERFPHKIEETKVINRELAIWITPENLLEVASFLRESELGFDHLRCLSGVDWKEYLEVVYHLYSLSRRHKVTVKVRLPLDNPAIPSLYQVYKGVDWHERETAEMFGIIFQGHPDPRHLLFFDEFKGYPLRKDFVCHHQER